MASLNFHCVNWFRQSSTRKYKILPVNKQLCFNPAYYKNKINCLSSLLVLSENCAFLLKMEYNSGIITSIFSDLCF